MNNNETLEVAAVWTNDCQGKKDYDGKIISLSTRYWPRGGGFHILSPGTGFVSSEKLHPEIKPSAKSSILLHFKVEDENEDGVLASDSRTLISQEFEADTFEELAPQVEQWAQMQFARVVRVLENEFAENRNEKE